MDIAHSIRARLDSVADRLGITPWSFLAGVAAVALAGFGGWWALAAPEPPAAEEILPSVEGIGSALPPAAAAAPTAPVIVVHVDGAVMRPGVHELTQGGRVIDAIEAAEGLRTDADRARLNLAAVLSDGQRLWVPVLGGDEPDVVAITGGGGDGPAPTPGPVDLNTAGVAELETLPGIGPSIAAAIVGHRSDNGRFERVDDLLEVSGIGPTRLAQLEPLVTV